MGRCIVNWNGNACTLKCVDGQGFVAETAASAEWRCCWSAETDAYHISVPTMYSIPVQWNADSAHSSPP